MLISCTLDMRQGFATFTTEFSSPQPVRALSDDYLDPKSKLGREALRSMLGHELERFSAVFVTGSS